MKKIINNKEEYLIDESGSIWNKHNKILKSFISKNGYKSITLGNKAKKENKGFTIHRLVAETFIPNPDNKPFVNHKDRNKLNNNVDNLEWVTERENFCHWLNNENENKTINQIIDIINSLQKDFLAYDLIPLLYTTKNPHLSNGG